VLPVVCDIEKQNMFQKVPLLFFSKPSICVGCFTGKCSSHPPTSCRSNQCISSRDCRLQRTTKLQKRVE